MERYGRLSVWSNAYEEYVGALHRQQSMGPKLSCRMRKKKGRKENKAIGKKGSSFKEELELVRHSSDLRFEDAFMRRAYYAGRSGDWESYLEEFRIDDRLSVRASITVRRNATTRQKKRTTPVQALRRTFCVKVRIS